MATTIEQIEALHHAEPFRKFALVLSDGQRFVIAQPEHLGRFPLGDRVFVSTPQDATQVIEVSRIKRVAIEADAGESKRKRAG